MKRKLLQKLVPGLCASLVLVSATSLTGCSTDTKTATTASDADKSETVYVKADASGTIHEIKVQTDLKNNGTSNEIKDFSTLKDIKNSPFFNFFNYIHLLGHLYPPHWIWRKGTVE